MDLDDTDKRVSGLPMNVWIARKLSVADTAKAAEKRARSGASLALCCNCWEGRNCPMKECPQGLKI